MGDSYLLLVEGPDDAHVFYHLSKHYQVHNQFTIKSKEGIDNLLGTLSAELKRSDLNRLGIVIDADTDFDARWLALQNILRQSGGVNLPSTPDPNGTIVAIEQPDRTLMTGIWIMPDNKLTGMLESFVSFLVPKDDTLWDRATDCVQQIPEQERLFPADHQDKACLHTWLAWQKEPGKPLGQAITKRYLDADAPHAQKLMAWLRRLFDI